VEGWLSIPAGGAGVGTFERSSAEEKPVQGRDGVAQVHRSVAIHLAPAEDLRARSRGVAEEDHVGEPVPVEWPQARAISHEGETSTGSRAVNARLAADW